MLCVAFRSGHINENHLKMIELFQVRNIVEGHYLPLLYLGIYICYRLDLISAKTSLSYAKLVYPKDVRIG